MKNRLKLIYLAYIALADPDNDKYYKKILYYSLVILLIAVGYSISEGLHLRNGLSDHLFYLLEYNKLSTEGLRYLNTLFLIPAYIIRNIFFNYEVTNIVSTLTGLSILLQHLVSIAACSLIIKNNNLKFENIYFPILSFTSTIALAAAWPANAIHTVAALVWPLLFLILANNNSIKNFLLTCLLILALGLTHETAFFVLLAIIYILSQRVFINKKVNYRTIAFVILAAGSMLSCVWRALATSEYHNKYQYLQFYKNYFSHLSQDNFMLIQGFILISFVFLQIFKPKNKIFQNLIIAFVALFMMLNSLDFANYSLSDRSRVIIPIYLMIWIFLFYFLAIKNNFKIISGVKYLLLLSIWIATFHQYTLVEEWVKSKKIIFKIASDTNNSCIQGNVSSFIPGLSPNDIFEQMRPILFTSIMLQNSKQIKFVVYDDVKLAVCEIIKSNGKLPVIIKLPFNEILKNEVPLTTPEGYFDFKHLMNKKP